MSTASISERLKNWLDGVGYCPGHPFTDPETRAAVLLGTLLLITSKLVDADTAEAGSDLVGVRDTGDYFTGTTLSAVLEEIGLALESAGVGADSFSDTNSFYATDTINAAFGQLALAIATKAKTTLTIATGAATATQSFHALDTEAAGASDDLDTLSGVNDGQMVFLTLANAAHNVVLKHGTGNLSCPGGLDITMDVVADLVLGVKNGSTIYLMPINLATFGAGGIGAILASVAAGKGAALIGIQDVATLITATTVEGALAELVAKIVALGAENTDGQQSIPLLSGKADGGTWAASITSGGLVSVTRTAADAPDSYWVNIPTPQRTTASKGIKPTGLKVNYTVNTADAADVRFEVWKITQGADNAARTAAVLFGDDNADYDGAHNTTAERGDDTAAPELHQVTVTDAGTPAYLGAGESLLLRCFVDGDAGAASVVVVTDAVLLFSETRVDLS